MYPEDIPAVAALDQACFSVPWSAQSFRAELENPITVYFVACAGEKIAGYCGFWQVADEGHITNVAVLERYRRQGVGSRLVARMKQYARTAGLTLMTLEVRPSNRAAVRLYEKYGFSAIGRRKNYYQKPAEDALIMTMYFDQE